MTLSRKATKLLNRLRKLDNWMYEDQIREQFREYDPRTFRAILQQGYLDHGCNSDDLQFDFDEHGNTIILEQYRISDAGHAYLEGVSTNKWVSFRAWLALVIALCSLIVAIIALIW